MLTAAFRVLRVGKRTADLIDPRQLAGELGDAGLLAKGADFYDAMIVRIGKHIDNRTAAAEELATSFTAMLCGILLMLCGLAFAALVG